MNGLQTTRGGASSMTQRFFSRAFERSDFEAFGFYALNIPDHFFDFLCIQRAIHRSEGKIQNDDENPRFFSEPFFGIR